MSAVAGKKGGFETRLYGKRGTGEGWIPASARTRRWAAPTRDGPTGGGMGPRIREGQRRWAAAHEGRPYGGRDGSPHPRRTTEVGGRPRGTALRGEGWVPASARTREGRAVPEPPLRVDDDRGRVVCLLGGLLIDLDAVPASVQNQDAVFGVYLHGDGLPEFLLFFRHVRHAGSLIPEGGVAP